MKKKQLLALLMISTLSIESIAGQINSISESRVQERIIPITKQIVITETETVFENTPVEVCEEGETKVIPEQHLNSKKTGMNTMLPIMTGVAGGVIGTTIGRGKGNVVSIVVGSILGTIAGLKAEETIQENQESSEKNENISNTNTVKSCHTVYKKLAKTITKERVNSIGEIKGKNGSVKEISIITEKGKEPKGFKIRETVVTTTTVESATPTF